MKPKVNLQKQLFPNNAGFSYEMARSKEEVKISKEGLIQWQKRIDFHQRNLFKNRQNTNQTSLFKNDEDIHVEDFAPLELAPLALNFWRWPSSPYTGPAIYMVVDKVEHLQTNILLYIGETIAADRRWKGEHDCKAYLEAYCESLNNVELRTQLSIRFSSDVPKETSKRRKIETALINLWLPPFNKESRERWSTPFTTRSD